MLLSTNIQVWFGRGKTYYWNFIYNRIVKHYTISKNYNNVSTKTIICMIDGFPGGQGGLTDRLRGILSVYSLCKKNNWLFKIYFDFPFDLRDYLIPNMYNWSIDKNSIRRELPYSRPIVLYLMNILFENYLDKKILNKEIIYNSSSQFHIYTNAFFNKKSFPKLFNELFKPSKNLQKEIEKNRGKLGSKFISATFRFQELLGDLIESSDCITLNIDEQNKLLNKCINKLKHFIENNKDYDKILVTSDSYRFLVEANKLDKVFIIPGKVYHPQHHADGIYPFTKSFVDFFILMQAQKIYLFQTGEMYKSGFPKFAALIGNKKYKHIKF